MPLVEEIPVPAVAIKNLLFATDFSEASEAALPYLTAIGQRYGSTLHLVHVLPDVVFLRPGAPDAAIIGSIYEDAHSSALDKMQRLEQHLNGIPQQTHIRHGATCQVLASLVKEHDIDLLVVGTRGRTGLGKLAMGSVAEELLRTVPCPVLTVGPKAVSGIPHARPNDGAASSPVDFRRILYATDLKQVSAEAVAYAVSLEREFGARLALLHVIENYGERLSESPNPIDTALHRLGELVPPDCGLEHPPELLAQFGPAAESILQTAVEREADLIILGTRPGRRHLGASTHFVRTVAHRIIVGANCPVLTVQA